MALKKGHAAEVIEANVADLMAAGYTEDRARKIAEDEAGRCRTDAQVMDSRRRAARDARLQIIDKEPFYTTEQLGKSRYFTPEGYLVCVGVPIARTGTQLYGEKELNRPGEDVVIKGDANGIVRVHRSEEEVFRPETIASAEGKSITIEHPPEFVTPENHKFYEVGHMQNVRRGEGIEDDLLVADWVIKDPIAIKYANEDRPEVSAGYDAGYRQEEDGEASQHAIVINHGAMVMRGRAGPRVAIKDSFSHEESEMAGKNKGVLTAVLNAMGFKTEDTAKIVTAVEAVDTTEGAPVQTQDSETLTLLKTMDARLKAIEDKRTADAAEEEEAKRKKAEDEQKVKDAQKALDDEMTEMESTGDTLLECDSPKAVINLGTVYTGDSGEKLEPLREIASRVEVLSPGFKMPTADSLKGTKGKVLAGVLRSAITAHQTKDSDGAQTVRTFLMGRTLDSLKGVELIGAFNGMAAMAAATNNTKQRAASAATTDAGMGRLPSISAMNEASRRAWPSAAEIAAAAAKKA